MSIKLLLGGISCGVFALWPVLTKSDVTIVVGRAPAAAAFAPDDIAELTLWLKADGDVYNTGTTQATDGQTVATWVDASGNGKNFTQATEGNKPTFQTGELNGKPVIRFDGIDNWISRTDDIQDAATAGEMFVVLKSDADPPGASTIPWDGVHNETSFFTLYPGTTGELHDHFGSTTWKNMANPALSLTSFRLYNVWSASGDWQCNLDTASHHSTGTNTVGFTGTTNFVIGCFNTSAAFPWGGDIAEICIFSKKLSTTERDNMEDYFDAKYALSY